MTQEEKDLLLKDISARLPYNVKIQGTVYEDILDNYGEETGIVNEELVTFILYIIGKDSIMYNGCWIPLESCKPYLRPTSSMTEKEIGHCNYLLFHMEDSLSYYDYLNSIHIDYRGLISMGLAIEVTEENNPYKY